MIRALEKALCTIYSLSFSTEWKEPQVCASEVALLKKCGRRWIQGVMGAGGGGGSVVGKLESRSLTDLFSLRDDQTGETKSY